MTEGSNGGARIEFDTPERRALFHSHLNPIWMLEQQLDELKDRQKKLRRQAKAEGIEGYEIAFALKVRKTEKTETIEERMKRQAVIARWMNIGIGHQFDWLDEDRRPAEDRAYDEGYTSGMFGDSLRNPFDTSLPQYKSYNDGWSKGQAELQAQMQKRMEEANSREAEAAAAKAAASVGGGETPSQEEIDALRSGEAESPPSPPAADDSYTGARDFEAEAEASDADEPAPDKEKPGHTYAGRVTKGGKAKLAAVH